MLTQTSVLYVNVKAQLYVAHYTEAFLNSVILYKLHKKLLFYLSLLYNLLSYFYCCVGGKRNSTCLQGCDYRLHIEL